MLTSFQVLQLAQPASKSLVTKVSILSFHTVPPSHTCTELIYWREAAAGHNRYAYYLGKVLSTFIRMTLSCLHFSVFLGVLATPLMSFSTIFAANLLYFYCIYGFSSCISMMTRREDGPLLAVMGSLILGILGGAAPPLSKVKTWHMAWLWRLSPGVS